jgi:hypothetical protein
MAAARSNAMVDTFGIGGLPRPSFGCLVGSFRATRITTLLSSCWDVDPPTRRA